MTTFLLLFSLLSPAELYNPQHSFPNLTGSTGLLRSTTAIPEEEAQFGSTLSFRFFQDDPFIDPRKHSRSRLRLSGNYQLPFGLQVFAGSQFTFNENSSSSLSRSSTSYFENSDIGLKWSREWVDDFLYAGATGWARFFSGTQQVRNVSGFTNTRSGPMVQAFFEALLTLDFRQRLKAFPLLAHVNLGYRSPNGNQRPIAGEPTNDRESQIEIFNLDQYRYHALTYTAALEFPFTYVNPFLEYSGEYALNSASDNVKFSDNRQELTVGLQGKPHPVVALMTAVDFGFFGNTKGRLVGIPESPDWEIHAAISFSTNGRKFFKNLGDLQGRVVDEETGLALPDVTIKILGSPRIPQATNTSGYYQIQNLEAGDYQLEISKPGYKTEVTSVRIRESRVNNLDLRLMPPGPAVGNLFVEIRDAITNEAIAGARVSLAGSDQLMVTDSSGRALLRELPIGAKELQIEAMGYELSLFPVEIFDGEQIEQSFRLQREAPQTGDFRGRVTNSEGTGLTAVFTDLDGQISPFGTDPLTGEFNEILAAGEWRLKVQAQNYLPQDISVIVPAGEAVLMEIVLEKPEKAVVVEDQILLPEAIYFAVNRAEIESQSLEIMAQVSQVLLENLDAFRILRIEGHTDSDGPEAYNKDLSERRARAIRDYLVMSGVPEEKMEAFGFGETQPIATNLTPEGKAENRRVEFNLVRD